MRRMLHEYPFEAITVIVSAVIAGAVLTVEPGAARDAIGLLASALLAAVGAGAYAERRTRQEFAERLGPVENHLQEYINRLDPRVRAGSPGNAEIILDWTYDDLVTLHHHIRQVLDPGAEREDTHASILASNQAFRSLGESALLDTVADFNAGDLTSAQFAAKVQQISEEHFAPMEVACPTCGAKKEISFPKDPAPNYTNTSTCWNCGELIHVHPRPNGEVKVNAGGSKRADASSTATTSPAQDLASMPIPQHDDRQRILSQLEKAYNEGRIVVARDMRRVPIEDLGVHLTAKEKQCYWWGLIAHHGGPVKLDDGSPDVALSERPVVALHDCPGPDSFVDQAEASWIAQALYTARDKDLSEEEIHQVSCPGSTETLGSGFRDDDGWERLVLHRLSQSLVLRRWDVAE